MMTGLMIMVVSWILTDPDLGLINDLPFGSNLVTVFTYASRAMILIALLHYCRKAVSDYFDMETAWRSVKDNPMAVAIYTLAIAVMTTAFATVIAAAFRA